MSTVKVTKELIVNASQERAFSVFTDGIDRWWPRGHHIGKSPLVKPIIEPRVGGRWYSTHEDGSETMTGYVRVWDPPHRLEMTWQISATWQFDPDLVSTVEVLFESLGPKETRVVFEHRGLEAYGPMAEQVRLTFEAPNAWGGMLAVYTTVAEAEA